MKKKVKVSTSKIIEKSKILKKIIKRLKLDEYYKIQYNPTSFSFLSIVKEHENIINLLFRNKHLLFYFSLFPKFYYFLLDSKIKKLFKIFYLNDLLNYDELKSFLDNNSIKKSLKLGILKKKNDQYKFNISFIPYKNYIFIRDTHSIYESHFDPQKSKDNIWMGSDSIIFLNFLNNYLKKNYFNKILEIGSGSGIVINSISKRFKKCEALDFNMRAVEFTLLNSIINNISNIKVYRSNLFKNVKGKFDLIIANPWFVDLKKGGLEEAPGIIKNLDKYLNEDGACLLILNSYVKKGNDTVLNYFLELLESKKYDVNLYTNGYGYETNRIKDYKKYKVDYYISYNVEIIKNGTGTLKKFEARYIRKIRDFTFINLIGFFRKIWLLT